MSGKQLAFLCLVSLAVLGMWTAPATAGLIENVNGYDDGVNDPWEGISTYSSGSLTGYIEWAVIGPGEFASNFPNAIFHDSDCVPPVDQFAYVYQIVNTGLAAVSRWEVFLDNEAGLVDWFSSSSNPLVDGVVPLGKQDTGSLAKWIFSSLSGGTTSSTCLVFSSPNKPMFYYGHIVNGSTCYVDDISSPGPERIPEPTTIWLVASGLCMALAYWWRRR